MSELGPATLTIKALINPALTELKRLETQGNGLLSSLSKTLKITVDGSQARTEIGKVVSGLTKVLDKKIKLEVDSAGILAGINPIKTTLAAITGKKITIDFDPTKATAGLTTLEAKLVSLKAIANPFVIHFDIQGNITQLQSLIAALQSIRATGTPPSGSSASAAVTQLATELRVLQNEQRTGLVTATQYAAELTRIQTAAQGMALGLSTGSRDAGILSGVVRTANAALNGMGGGIANVNSEITNLKSQMAAARAALDSGRSSATQYEAELHRLQGEFRALGASGQASAKELTQINNLIANTGRQINTLNGRVNLTGLSGNIETALQGFLSLNPQVSSLTTLFGGLTGAGGAAAAAIVGIGLALGGLVMGMAKAIELAADFEQQMGGISSLGNDSAESLGQLRDRILEITTRLPIAAGQLTNVTREAELLGVRGKDVGDFTETIAKLGIATRENNQHMIDLGQTTKTFARFLNETGSSAKTMSVDLANATAAIAAVDKHMDATIPETLSMATNIGKMGISAGLTREQIIGFSAALVGLGAKPEAAATALSTILFKLEGAVNTGGPKLTAYAKAANMTEEAFSTLVKANPGEAFIALSKGIGESGVKGAAFRSVMSDLGVENVRTIGLLGTSAQGWRKLAESVEIATHAGQNKADLDKRVADASSNLNDRVTILKNNFNQLGINLGQYLLPFLTRVVDGLAGLTKGFADSLKDGQALTNFINSDLKPALIFISGILVAIKLNAIAAFGLNMVGTLAGYAAALTAPGGVALALGTVGTALKGVLLANPFGVLIIAATALGAYMQKLFGDIEAINAKVAADATQSLNQFSDKINALKGTGKESDSLKAASLAIIQYKVDVAGAGEIDGLNKRLEELRIKTIAAEKSEAAAAITNKAHTDALAKQVPVLDAAGKSLAALPADYISSAKASKLLEMATDDTQKATIKLKDALEQAKAAGDVSTTVKLEGAIKALGKSSSEAKNTLAALGTSLKVAGEKASGLGEDFDQLDKKLKLSKVNFESGATTGAQYAAMLKNIAVEADRLSKAEDPQSARYLGFREQIKTVTQDLKAYYKELENTGSAKIKASQLETAYQNMLEKSSVAVLKVKLAEAERAGNFDKYKAIQAEIINKEGDRAKGAIQIKAAEAEAKYQKALEASSLAVLKVMSAEAQRVGDFDKYKSIQSEIATKEKDIEKTHLEHVKVIDEVKQSYADLKKTILEQIKTGEYNTEKQKDAQDKLVELSTKLQDAGVYTNDLIVPTRESAIAFAASAVALNEQAKAALKAKEELKAFNDFQNAAKFDVWKKDLSSLSIEYLQYAEEINNTADKLKYLGPIQEALAQKTAALKAEFDKLTFEGIKEGIQKIPWDALQKGIAEAREQWNKFADSSSLEVLNIQLAEAKKRTDEWNQILKAGETKDFTESLKGMSEATLQETLALQKQHLELKDGLGDTNKYNAAQAESESRVKALGDALKSIDMAEYAASISGLTAEEAKLEAVTRQNAGETDKAAVAISQWVSKAGEAATAAKAWKDQLKGLHDELEKEGLQLDTDKELAEKYNAAVYAGDGKSVTILGAELQRRVDQMVKDAGSSLASGRAEIQAKLDDLLKLFINPEGVDSNFGDYLNAPGKAIRKAREEIRKLGLEKPETINLLGDLPKSIANLEADLSEPFVILGNVQRAAENVGTALKAALGDPNLTALSRQQLEALELRISKINGAIAALATLKGSNNTPSLPDNQVDRGFEGATETADQLASVSEQAQAATENVAALREAFKTILDVDLNAQLEQLTQMGLEGSDLANIIQDEITRRLNLAEGVMFDIDDAMSQIIATTDEGGKTFSKLGGEVEDVKADFVDLAAIDFSKITDNDLNTWLGSVAVNSDQAKAVMAEMQKRADDAQKELAQWIQDSEALEKQGYETQLADLENNHTAGLVLDAEYYASKKEILLNLLEFQRNQELDKVDQNSPTKNEQLTAINLKFDKEAAKTDLEAIKQFLQLEMADISDDMTVAASDLEARVDDGFRGAAGELQKQSKAILDALAINPSAATELADQYGHLLTMIGIQLGDSTLPDEVRKNLEATQAALTEGYGAATKTALENLLADVEAAQSGAADRIDEGFNTVAGKLQTGVQQTLDALAIDPNGADALKDDYGRLITALELEIGDLNAPDEAKKMNQETLAALQAGVQLARAKQAQGFTDQLKALETSHANLSVTDEIYYAKKRDILVKQLEFEKRLAIEAIPLSDPNSKALRGAKAKEFDDKILAVKLEFDTSSADQGIADMATHLEDKLTASTDAMVSIWDDATTELAGSSNRIITALSLDPNAVDILKSEYERLAFDIQAQLDNKSLPDDIRQRNQEILAALQEAIKTAVERQKSGLADQFTALEKSHNDNLISEQAYLEQKRDLDLAQLDWDKAQALKAVVGDDPTAKAKRLLIEANYQRSRTALVHSSSTAIKAAMTKESADELTILEAKHAQGLISEKAYLDQKQAIDLKRLEDEKTRALDEVVGDSPAAAEKRLLIEAKYQTDRAALIKSSKSAISSVELQEAADSLAILENKHNQALIGEVDYLKKKKELLLAQLELERQAALNKPGANKDVVNAEFDDKIEKITVEISTQLNAPSLADSLEELKTTVEEGARGLSGELYERGKKVLDAFALDPSKVTELADEYGVLVTALTGELNDPEAAPEVKQQNQDILDALKEGITLARAAQASAITEDLAELERSHTSKLISEEDYLKKRQELLIKQLEFERVSRLALIADSDPNAQGKKDAINNEINRKEIQVNFVADADLREVLLKKDLPLMIKTNIEKSFKAGADPTAGAEKLSSVLGGVAGGLGGLINPMGLLADIIGRVNVVGTILDAVFEVLKEPIALLQEPLKTLGTLIGNVLAPIVAAFAPGLNAVMILLSPFLEALTPIVTFLSGIMLPVFKLLEPVLHGIATIFTTLYDALAGFIKAITFGLVDIGRKPNGASGPSEKYLSTKDQNDLSQTELDYKAGRISENDYQNQIWAIKSAALLRQHEAERAAFKGTADERWEFERAYNLSVQKLWTDTIGAISKPKEGDLTNKEQHDLFDLEGGRAKGLITEAEYQQQVYDIKKAALERQHAAELDAFKGTAAEKSEFERGQNQETAKLWNETVGSIKTPPKGSIADLEDQKSKKEAALKNATTDEERTQLKGEIKVLAGQIEALAKSTTGASKGSINALEEQKSALEKLFKEATTDADRNRIGKEIAQVAAAIEKLSSQGKPNDSGKDANGNTLSGGDIKVEASFTQDAINNLRADLVNVGRIFQEQIGKLIDAFRPLVTPQGTPTGTPQGTSGGAGAGTTRAKSLATQTGPKTVDSSGYTISSSGGNNKPESSADMALFASSVRLYDSSTSKLDSSILAVLAGQAARKPSFRGDSLDATSVALFASSTQVYATATGVLAGAAREIVGAAADMKAAAALQKSQTRGWDAGKF